MDILSVYNIGGQDYTVAYTGQEAIKVLRVRYGRKRLVLKGFMIDSVFHPLQFSRY